MALSKELTWRGFVNQTTYKDPTLLDGKPITLYFGVDPSADSMQIGNLAAAMMVRHFIESGHKAILLVGGATGLIGDPDGKSKERDLQSKKDIDHNKASIVAQYGTIFVGKKFEVVDNYDWFKDVGYVDFLRDVGKHVPLRQMMGRDFVQSRIGESGNGISYAEFSYALLQAYDFLHLHKKKNVTLQLCGSDQWGNSIAGVDLIRRVTGDETHVWSTPLIINKSTGVKFGKSEDGAIWLDPAKTSPTKFYQFWINCDDAGVEDYLKIYTMFGQKEIEQIMSEHSTNPNQRLAQTHLAKAVTEIVHGKQKTADAEAVTEVLTGKRSIKNIGPVIDDLRQEIACVQTPQDGSVIEALVLSGLASSNTEARRFLQNNAISVNGVKNSAESFEKNSFIDGKLLLRRGKAFKDTALVELG